MGETFLFEGEMLCPQCDGILGDVENIRDFPATFDPHMGVSIYGHTAGWFYEKVGIGDYACYFCSWVWTKETVINYNNEIDKSAKRFKEIKDGAVETIDFSKLSKKIQE
jgi:hypothetical protein